MTDDKPGLAEIAQMTARELLRLPLASLNNLLRDAMEETRKAKRRENWLRALCVEKIRNRSWGDQ